MVQIVISACEKRGQWWQVAGVLKEILTRTDQFQTALNSSKEKAVQDATAKASKLLSSTSSTDERAFRAEMRKLGNQIAKHQKDLQSAIQDVTAETASGQVVVSDVCKEAQAVADQCMFYICMYVAVTLWSTVEKTSGPAHATLLNNLETTLSSLPKIEDKDQIFVKLIGEMRAFVTTESTASGQEAQMKSSSSDDAPAGKRRKIQSTSSSPSLIAFTSCPLWLHPWLLQ